MPRPSNVSGLRELASAEEAMESGFHGSSREQNVG